MLMVTRPKSAPPRTAPGERYGKLMIIDPGPLYYSGDSHEAKVRRVEVLCECGAQYYTREAAVVHGNATQCMGCKHKAQSVLMSRDYTGWNIWKNLYVQNAKAKQRFFELGDEEFMALCQDNCFYCGAPPALRNFVRNNTILANGIDRVDSSGGYTTQNTVACCTVCNKMKLNMSTHDFLSHIEKICQFGLKKER